MTKIDGQTANYMFCMDTIKRNTGLELGFLEQAERFHQIHYTRMFEPAWSSFEEFCMELKNMSYTSVMKLIDIHATFVLNYKIAPARLAEVGGWTKLAEITPLVKSKADAEKWIEKSAELSRQDLRKEITEEKSGKQMADCSHKNAYTISVCPDCGDRHRV